MKNRHSVFFFMFWYSIALSVLLPLAAAQIGVESITTNPETVSPGEEIELVLNLKNMGDDDMENVAVSLNLVNVPFAPLGSASEKVIRKISDGDRKSVTFTLLAAPDAEPRVYKIPLVISSGVNSQTSLVSIEISASAKLDVLLEQMNVVTVGSQGKVFLQFVNNGLAQVRLLKVTLRESPAYEILSPRSVYIGEVDVADFETAEFTIIPTTGDPILALALEYQDARNQQLSEVKLLKLDVYSEEEAATLGLQQDSSGRTITFISVLAGIILIFILRKMWKRKHAS